MSQAEVRTPIEYSSKESQREIRHIISDLDLCGCGTGTAHQIVLLMLQRAHSMNAGGPSFYDEPRGSSINAVEFIAHVMSSAKWGLLEHGTGIGSSWVTDKGKKLLEFYTKMGTNDNNWPDWVQSCDVNEEW